jgi:hypothetical protein
LLSPLKGRQEIAQRFNAGIGSTFFRFKAPGGATETCMSRARSAEGVSVAPAGALDVFGGFLPSVETLGYFRAPPRGGSIDPECDGRNSHPEKHPPAYCRRLAWRRVSSRSEKSTAEPKRLS